jgi:hypothetical protein
VTPVSWIADFRQTVRTDRDVRADEDAVGGVILALEDGKSGEIRPGGDVLGPQGDDFGQRGQLRHKAPEKALHLRGGTVEFDLHALGGVADMAS